MVSKEGIAELFQKAYPQKEGSDCLKNTAFATQRGADVLEIRGGAVWVNNGMLLPAVVREGEVWPLTNEQPGAHHNCRAMRIVEKASSEEAVVVEYEDCGGKRVPVYRERWLRGQGLIETRAVAEGGRCLVAVRRLSCDSVGLR